MAKMQQQFGIMIFRFIIMTFYVNFSILILFATLPALSCTVADSSLDSLDSAGAMSSDEWFKEKKLVKMLLSQQDGRQLGRPVSNYSLPVEVEFGINLIQVLRVNEESGQLITNIWTHFRWCDPSLAWNQTLINVDIVRIPAEEIWTPDVALFNYADDRMRQHRSTLAVVNSSGCLDWIPTGIFKSACSIDTFSFPFDEQICLMTFRSLSMGINTLTLKFVDNRESMSLDSYVPNPEWEIADNVAVRSIKEGKHGLHTTFHDLTFTLRLKRRSVFHRYVLVLPCVLLSLTAGVLFILPPESPAKIQIGIFIFQGFFLLLNLLKNSTPPSGSRSPIIGLYYSMSMIATTVVMFACGFLVEIHFRADCKAPMTDRLRNVVIKRFAAWLFIPIPPKSPLEIKRERKMLKAEAQLADRNYYQQRNAMLVGARCAVPIINDVRQSSKKKNTLAVLSNTKQRLSTWGKALLSPTRIRTKLVAAVNNEEETSSAGPVLTPDRKAADVGVFGDLVELRKTFQRVAEKQAAREYTDLVKQEWLIAIMVFDRIFFFVYVIYIIASLYLLLPREEADIFLN